jgi:hypothetical protein
MNHAHMMLGDTLKKINAEKRESYLKVDLKLLLSYVKPPYYAM